MAYVRSQIIATDIEHLDQYTPEALQNLSEHFPDLDDITATIYHFGYSERKNRFLCHVYRSTSDWNSEQILEGIGVKPAINYDFGEKFTLPGSFIDLIKLQRENDLNMPTDKRVGIGGDIHFIVMDRAGINISKCHRFESYEEDLNTMCAEIEKT